ncbi:putative conserved membrane protein [Synechococcus sp. RS9915]|nr:putative conserved membrane protein [Synechococcus sp. RS9915]
MVPSARTGITAGTPKSLTFIKIKIAVLDVLFPLIYAALFTGLLLQAFRMMSMSSNASTAFKSDRTGLRTVHPELLDDNGNVTDEELWSVRFQDLKQTGWAPEAG